jgi:ATP-dependent RNA helicase HelY
VPQFDGLRGLLEEWGYLEGWSLTDPGRRLRTIYNELDLLLADAIGRGAFDRLDEAETAAVASLFTYESRSADDTEPAWPTARVGERAAAVAERWRRLSRAERTRGLPVTRQPDAGFAEIAYRWAAGESLEELFEEDAFGVGDFVRNCRQLIDLLRQIADAHPARREAVTRAAAALDRGVVAAVGPA